MAIIIGGQVIDINQLKQAQTPAPVEKPVESTDFKLSSPKKIQRKQTPKIKDGHTLVVNGKQKTIGRKSQYLLDMMIIDEE